jgi:CheY-like chemotaxis protein
MRVLVVDDNPDVLTSLELILHGAGYETVTCLDGREAIASNEAEPADVLIADLFMPGYDGLQTITHFKTRWPGTKILAISGGGRYVKGNYLEVALEAGAHAAVRKPFTPEGLLELVSQLVT